MSHVRYLYDADILVPWAEKRIDRFSARDDAKAIGMAVDRQIVAAVLFDTFTTTSCMVHLASDGSKRFIRRDFGLIRHAMAYPFVQLGLPRITCMISENNSASLRFTRHFGWVEEGRLREAGEDGEDVIVFGLLRRECKWLPVFFAPTKAA